MAKEAILTENQFMEGYRIRIYPDEFQASKIDRYFDLNVDIYNWALEQELNQYELYKAGLSDKKFLTYYDLINMFTTFRNENEWVREIQYGSGCKSIQRAVVAFNMFFKSHGRFPKFKAKKHLRKLSYGVRHDTMRFDDNMLRIEGFDKTKILTKWHKNPFVKGTKFYNPVITKDNRGRYFISFSIVKDKPQSEYNYSSPSENPLGIDLNVRDRFVCSNGYRSGSPDLSRLKRGLSDAERKVQNDIKRRREEARTKSLEYSSIESSNRAKKRLELRNKRLDKMSNVVENFIQNETIKIIRMNPSAIVMEDLSVGDMEKNRKVAKMVYNGNFNRCVTVMQQKCNKYGIPFILADKDYPSSQLCSNCGHRQKIYSQKVYKCPVCGLEIDRDLNAARNLRSLAL